MKARDKKAAEPPKNEDEVGHSPERSREGAIGSVLFALRVNRGLTRRDVSKRMRLEERIVDDLERFGERARFDRVLRYVEALEDAAPSARTPGPESVEEKIRDHLAEVIKLLNEKV